MKCRFQKEKGHRNHQLRSVLVHCFSAVLWRKALPSLWCWSWIRTVFPLWRIQLPDLFNYLNLPIAPPIEQVGPSDTLSGAAQCAVWVCVRVAVSLSAVVSLICPGWLCATALIDTPLCGKLQPQTEPLKGKDQHEILVTWALESQWDGIFISSSVMREEYEEYELCFKTVGWFYHLKTQRMLEGNWKRQNRIYNLCLWHVRLITGSIVRW